MSEYPRRDYVQCPFCGEEDFNLIGLRHHFERGHCEEYNKAVDEVKLGE